MTLNIGEFVVIAELNYFSGYYYKIFRKLFAQNGEPETSFLVLLAPEQLTRGYCQPRAQRWRFLLGRARLFGINPE